MVVILFSLLTTNTTTFASENEFESKEEFEEHIEKVEQEVKELNRDSDIFKKITDEDYLKMLPEIEKLETENPNLSEEELNELAYVLFAEKYGNNIISPYYIAIGGANAQEVALCARHPIRCTKAKNNANSANTQATAYYKAGLHNGNGDAFRHAYWNNLMVRSIGAGPAAEFANAHEYGAKNAPALETKMDLHNNKVGRHSISGSTAASVRNAITNGQGVRIVSNKLYKSNGEGLK